MHRNMIEALTDKVMQQLPQGGQRLKTGLDKSLRVVLEEIFARMALVGRDEFDAQTKVLARTQQQLKQLEAKLAQLEQIRS